MNNNYENYSGAGQTRCEVIKVKGEGGAKSVKIPPNSSCLAMDIDSPIVYLIMTDATGFPTVEAYSITRVPTESEKQASKLDAVLNSIGALTERIDSIEKRLPVAYGKERVKNESHA